MPADAAVSVTDSVTARPLWRRSAQGSYRRGRSWEPHGQGARGRVTNKPGRGRQPSDRACRRTPTSSASPLWLLAAVGDVCLRRHRCRWLDCSPVTSGKPATRSSLCQTDHQDQPRRGPPRPPIARSPATTCLRTPGGSRYWSTLCRYEAAEGFRSSARRRLTVPYTPSRPAAVALPAAISGWLARMPAALTPSSDGTSNLAVSVVVAVSTPSPRSALPRSWAGLVNLPPPRRAGMPPTPLYP